MNLANVTDLTKFSTFVVTCISGHSTCMEMYMTKL